MNDWFSISNGNGSNIGLNDSGIEFFSHDSIKMHSLIREAIQNSLDATISPDIPVRVTFSIFKIPPTKIPGHTRLTKIFKQCCNSNDPRTKFFLKQVSIFYKVVREYMSCVLVMKILLDWRAQNQMKLIRLTHHGHV